ncbi:MAG: hypothetical protein QW270_07885 [Candidatus Bathyarchaeia archaeon]
MSVKSKFKIESIGMFVAFIFYAVAGVICFVVLPMANFPLHVGIMGVLNLITAYGLFKKRFWALWAVVMLFFIVTTFSTFTLLWGGEFLLIVSAVAYLVLTWVFTAYTAAKRKKLEG